MDDTSATPSTEPRSGLTRQALAGALIDAGCDPAKVERSILDEAAEPAVVPSEPEYVPEISDELAWLGDEINTGVLMLADSTFWLVGNPDIDPLDFRDAAVELTCLQLDEFFDIVAPGKVAVRYLA